MDVKGKERVCRVMKKEAKGKEGMRARMRMSGERGVLPSASSPRMSDASSGRKV